MRKEEFIVTIQEKLVSGYKVLDFIHHNKTLVISIDDNVACIEFEEIRQAIKKQLENVKFVLNFEKTEKKEEFVLGKIVKATIGDKNSFDLSYNLKRTGR